MRILLIEDEADLADALAYILKKNNYMVDVAYDGISGEEMAETCIYDLLVLDRMLPGKEGVAILKNLRGKGIRTPVLLLTARDSVEDRVEGLNSGADDYLVKPFAAEELLARIGALSRRAGEQYVEDKLRAGSLVLDPLRCEAYCDGDMIRLTLKESQLLEYLIRNRGQVVTKEQILAKVWGLDSEVDLNNVEIYVHFLRKKLKPRHCGVEIETVRGIGYCFKEKKSVSQSKA